MTQKTHILITKEISESGDPSEKIQSFIAMKPTILCSRYWWFDAWKGQRMSFRFWRLYWNKNEGAYVYYKKKTFLKPDQLYLIPPNTPFSNGIENSPLWDKSEYFFKCGRINSKKEESFHLENGSILHFFIHFTLGLPYDSVIPGIYAVRLSDQNKTNIESITSTLLSHHSNFSLGYSLNVYNLIISAVSSLPGRIWSSKKLDARINTVLEYLEKNLRETITNEMLATLINLSPSTFLRLFKSQVGISASKYLTQIRIDHACNLLLYTSKSIESIAECCGFSDRYHLTKVFSKTKSVSPAAFRKRGGYY